MDSQSLLPDDDDDDDGGISDARATPAALWAASSSHAKKARVDSNADELTTPKRTGTVAVGGSVTGSAKRKQTTPKSKKGRPHLLDLIDLYIYHKPTPGTPQNKFN